jgi:hypothetical protein
MRLPCTVVKGGCNVQPSPRLASCCSVAGWLAPWGSAFCQLRQARGGCGSGGSADAGIVTATETMRAAGMRAGEDRGRQDHPRGGAPDPRAPPAQASPGPCCACRRRSGLRHKVLRCPGLCVARCCLSHAMACVSKHATRFVLALASRWSFFREQSPSSRSRAAGGQGGGGYMTLQLCGAVNEWYLGGLVAEAVCMCPARARRRGHLLCSKVGPHGRRGRRGGLPERKEDGGREGPACLSRQVRQEVLGHLQGPGYPAEGLLPVRTMRLCEEPLCV